jgi:hypothetical protein
MSREQAVRAWLRARGAETVAHPGGTLYAHLGRVHDRLAALGHSPQVAVAGLAHAAYGTDGFDLTLLDVTDRAVLRELTGPDAEELIYLYGACDRSRTWQSLPDTHQVWDRFTGAARPLAPEQVRPFADLSLVNELDVGFAPQHAAYFRALVEAWAPLVSPAVLAEARKALAR